MREPGAHTHNKCAIAGSSDSLLLLTGLVWMVELHTEIACPFVRCVRRRLKRPASVSSGICVCRAHMHTHAHIYTLTRSLIIKCAEEIEYTTRSRICGVRCLFCTSVRRSVPWRACRYQLKFMCIICCTSHLSSCVSGFEYLRVCSG